VTGSPNGRQRAGIDVGGTKCLGVVIDEAGEVVRQDRRPSPNDPVRLIDALAELANELAPYDSLGVGVPGLVTRSGALRAAPNLGRVNELAVGPLLESRLGHPVAVDNDATCGVAAEWLIGAARGFDDAVLVTLGTGIGGGVVAGGRIVRGANGFAGEIGHMVVDPDGPPCVCGRRGCWERYASGSGIRRQALEAIEAGRLDSVVEIAGGDREAVRGEHVHAAARAGDPQAMTVFDDFARWVAVGLVNLTNLLDPAVFVLGGGLAEAGDLVLSPARKWFSRLLYAPTHRPHPQLRLAALGERAGAVGAALLVDVR
jgi:glucokinase